MAATSDDPIANWQRNVGTLRKRLRISGAALSIVPAGAIDVRQAPPTPPERLSEAERALWVRLIESRRPGWFAEGQPGGFGALLRDDPGGGADRGRAAQAHAWQRPARQTGTLPSASGRAGGHVGDKAAAVPSTRLDRRTPQEGDAPLVA